MDLINECEKLADYVVNVVEARMGTRQKTLWRINSFLGADYADDTEEDKIRVIRA